MISTHFQKLYTDFFKAGLNPTEVALLTVIYNRNQLSMNNPKFYDKQLNDHYVVYPIADLKAEINVSESTIKRTLKTLEKKGWIILKRSKLSRVNLIFIAQDKKVETKTEEKISKENSIKDNCTGQKATSIEESNGSSKSRNYSSLHYEKVNLTPLKSSICTPIKTDNKNINYKYTYRFNNDSKNSEQKQNYEEQALTETMLHQGLPEEAINLIQVWTNHNPKKQKEIKDQIFKAKAFAQKRANAQGAAIELTFENNSFDTQSFVNQLNLILVKAFKTAKKPMNYIFWSVFNYFELEINRELKQSSLEKNNSQQVRIPLTAWVSDNNEKSEEDILC